MKLIEADEAFRILSAYYHHRTETQADALREALDRVPEVVLNANITEYIVRETSYQTATKQEVIGEIVRCKDCIYYNRSEVSGKFLDFCSYSGTWCDLIEDPVSDFCSHGERKTAESE